ncbi:hypothetical protein F5X68DRAFT_42760 [Plectosphaerella plurivora]|uniref:Uncharacterized protein n=1 Tax=Plectosphaerella plurivora TaxID=936078 RepID=A0A9P8V4C2_9PEZI|nr:hypothetical protein F5X68DRAFT_42760 [Plectosphaerella plurivora]
MALRGPHWPAISCFVGGRGRMGWVSGPLVLSLGEAVPMPVASSPIIARKGHFRSTEHSFVTYDGVCRGLGSVQKAAENCGRATWFGLGCSIFDSAGCFVVGGNVGVETRRGGRVGSTSRALATEGSFEAPCGFTPMGRRRRHLTFIYNKSTPRLDSPASPGRGRGIGNVSSPLCTVSWQHAARPHRCTTACFQWLQVTERARFDDA